MTAYYFAARYSRNAEMRRYRTELTELLPDAKVTSRWIDQHGGTLLNSVVAEKLNSRPGECWHYADADLQDMRAADVLVSFTETEPGTSKGGRHVEYGYALGAGHRIVIVGPRENVFHTLPGVEAYPTWADFLAAEVASGTEG